MTSIIASIKDLISSVFEVIFSTITTAFDAVFSVFHFLLSAVTSVFGQVVSTLEDTLGIAAGAAKFVASNIIGLTLIGIGIYAFLNYKSRQGQAVKVGNKKLN
ncbi:hypothetical protein PENSTE_c009G00988 [Penicillium steckii]|uniref:Uncharacterized protein n=1 Tax=Penicillium steckii TaxID=303698 RepID=A0A1V6TAW9_9EURO|nr:hypothetical protein PENSTE_c009G00988 [Penicillium steckii]